MTGIVRLFLALALFCPPLGAQTLSPDAAGQGLSIAQPQVLDLTADDEPIITVDLTHQAADLWDRIRRGFAMPDLDSEEVATQQIRYLSHPNALRSLFERSYRYLYHIVDALERRGLPTELALLPMVESGFNPMALSSSRAAGLWQFIPSTGRYFKLDQNEWVDERRDIVASTEAALDYLERIYDMHGDWHLALASYNWGEGAVARARKKNEAAGLPTELAYLKLPDETRRYVPKLLALKNIIARPELFNIELPHVPNRLYFETVESPPGIDLAMAAAFAQLPLEELVALNPAFRRPVIPEGRQQLILPADRVDLFQSKLAGAGPRWQTYRLGNSESVESVAGKFGLTLTELLQVNGLTSPFNLKSGTVLLVPAGADVQAVMPLTNLIPDLPSAKEISTQAPKKKKSKRRNKKRR
ncbi:transglycosylase SLT domain-containing protein [Denitromonas ohlonensis]|uniref:LysM peptidoglycan-binding domain-containing protein n=2 Tax=Denitromonas TaxID=139331 RepID=A0A557RW45_9RHOO|nr:transglycosylase SLT domain-containing protein [Denitromonas ohlonensis]TVT48551.1 MAG: LysM peptidoglycan-binding domain-containing protein [Denitromonas halophila]TVO69373.1 LysM peptidoglycan-binding domain-containing protein [Denitromonas ohlonensis]TVO77473.1 LysM peptidoglycan-binding domain-containing protein [Denitromonas ohlonensis]TVT73130.1 MAG: LysM peptidoglycan-binding domain-containing protein [Denitromonas halophila]TVT74185.1 MAG: LysM peptidoglycan-binding domain-containin